MTVTVLLFARLRELLDTDRVTLELSTPTVAELRRIFTATYPLAAELLARSAVAVNNDYADDRRTIASTDEIALIPPVSGGNR